MTSVRAPAMLLTAALAAAGCESPDYGEARRSRNDWTYRGGAASVAGDDAEAAAERRPSDVELITFMAVLGVMFTHGVDGAGNEWEPSASPPPPIPVR